MPAEEGCPDCSGPAVCGAADGEPVPVSQHAAGEGSAGARRHGLRLGQ